MTIQHRVLAAGLAALAGLAASTANAETVYGVTLQQTLVSWDSGTPGTLASGMAISGLQPNEVVMGIDFRPATGQMYALGSFSRLYTINTATGIATQVGSSFALPLNGSSFGFDFNPTVDRIRVTSDADQNMRVHPVTGAVVDSDLVTPGLQIDGNISYAAGDPNFGSNANAVHAAYTNSFAGATTTTLYVIDSGLDVLAIQNANLGTLTTIGSVGTDISDIGGFDISGLTGVAYAVVRDSQLGRSTFWTINLATGQGTMIGEIGGGAIITAMTVVPTPGAIAAGAVGLGLTALRRRR